MPARPSPASRKVIEAMAKEPGIFFARSRLVLITKLEAHQVRGVLRALATKKINLSEYGQGDLVYENKGKGAGMRHRLIEKDSQSTADGPAEAKLKGKSEPSTLSDSDLAAEYLGGILAQHKRMTEALVQIRSVINEALEGTEHG